ncbi:MAG: hypothetical protein ACXACY_23455 [Candidatus Hodarchaeales archaeon]|jgi:hypothetical protein
MSKNFDFEIPIEIEIDNEWFLFCPLHLKEIQFCFCLFKDRQEMFNSWKGFCPKCFNQCADIIDDICCECSDLSNSQYCFLCERKVIVCSK